MTPPFRRPPGFAVAAIALLALTPLPVTADSGPKSLAEYRALVEARIAAQTPAEPEGPLHLQSCIDGTAGGYPCSNIDLVEFMPYAQFTPDPGESDKTNSLWGWIDPVTGHEWALLGLNNGVAFVDITDPENPFYVGKLPSHNGIVSLWRDVRAYQDHAYVVADVFGAHGMQVFDLTQLRTAPPPYPRTFTETAFYNAQGLGQVHTISVNEDTGFAYLAGSDTCGSRLHMVNLANPAAPTFAGCTTDGSYVHENQCFTYHGPDTTYTGHEICLAARGYALNLDILDVTNKAAPVRLSSLHYNNQSGYSHQAWFTEDHRYILLNDELDENDLGLATRTWIIDAANLDAPVLAGNGGYHQHATPAIDHNLYVHGDFVFESNYTAGVRILRLTNLAQSQLTEVGYFDLYPGNDSPNFDGTWNNYYFPSGNLIATHMTQGMFILRPTNLCDTPTTPINVVATPNGDHRIDLSWEGSGTSGNTFEVERALGGCAGVFESIATGVPASPYSDLTASGQVTYGYRVREHDASGACVSEPSTCVEASTTGSCTAPPLFAGLVSATNSGDSACRIDLAWSPATATCSGPATYSVYRADTPDFTPAPANRIAQGVTGTTFADTTPPAQQTVYYIVRAVDAGNGAEEGNLVRRSARATGPVGDGTFTTGGEVGDFMFDTGDSSPGGGDDPQHVGWHVTTARHHDGARSFWSTSGSNLCLTLEGDFSLTAGQTPQLTFWTAYDIEPGWDGGVIDISTNGGTTWTRLTPVGGYPGSITNSGNACGFPIGANSVFNGTALGFLQKTVALASYQGQDVRLRFRFSTDSAVNPEGWYVDDVALTHAQVPTACSSSVILIADHEEGDTSDWTSTTP